MTDDDHRAWIIITAAMGVSIMVVAFLARIFVRRFINMGWTLDDTMLAVATVCSTVHPLVRFPADNENQGYCTRAVLTTANCML